MSGKNSCKNCGSFDLEVDPSRGDTVCTVCGTVLEDSVIVSEVQFEENAHGGSSAIGQFVSSDSKGGGSLSIMGSFSHGIQKESREITIQKAKSELSRMCQQLRINQHCLETALTFYKMALGRHLTKGRRSSLVCAACLYIACRLEKTPHLLIDFSDVLQVDPFTLGRTFTSITQDLCITLPLVDPCLYILRYANQMNLGEKTHEVSTTALRVLKRMKRDSLHCGRRPSGLCGSALIIAARFHNIRKKLKDIVNIVHIQEVTLRKRLLEFGDTPSSLLTTDEFLTVDLGEEQDPPSFKAARIKDKERLQKYTDVEYEMKMQKLQRLIEKELEKKKAKGRRFSVSSVDTDMTSADTNDDAASTKSGMLKDTLDDIIDDEGEISEAVVQSTLECIDNVCDTMKSPPSDAEIKAASPKGLGPTLETIGIAGEEAEPIPPVADQQPKPTESSDKPDQFEMEHSLDDLDDEELDSYIVTDEEFQQKKKAWMDLYAAFLEEQKKKEEEKLLKEKEDGKGDKKRKRQKRTKGSTAATAGEAVEKVLREKKISNKLNYDVLKSLNMNDFVKSMNFGSAAAMKEIESKAREGKSSDEPVPKKLPRLDDEQVSKDAADPGEKKRILPVGRIKPRKRDMKTNYAVDRYFRKASRTSEPNAPRVLNFMINCGILQTMIVFLVLLFFGNLACEARPYDIKVSSQISEEKLKAILLQFKCEKNWRVLSDDEKKDIVFQAVAQLGIQIEATLAESVVKKLRQTLEKLVNIAKENKYIARTAEREPDPKSSENPQHLIRAKEIATSVKEKKRQDKFIANFRYYYRVFLTILNSVEGGVLKNENAVKYFNGMKSDQISSKDFAIATAKLYSILHDVIHNKNLEHGVDWSREDDVIEVLKKWEILEDDCPNLIMAATTILKMSKTL